jgi:hypothetical protein
MDQGVMSKRSHWTLARSNRDRLEIRTNDLKKQTYIELDQFKLGFIMTEY